MKRWFSPKLALILIPVTHCFHLVVLKAPENELFRSWNRPVEPYKIISNIYYVGASDVTSFLITTPKGHILIDSGFEETVPIIRASMDRLGFRMQDIEILLNSHGHKDHAGGLALLKKLTGARLITSKAAGELIANGGRNDYHLGDTWTYPPARVDRILKDREQITLGGVTLTAYLSPGHTKGCTTWHASVEEDGQRYDVVFVGSTSVLHGVKLVNNPNYPEIAKDYAGTFQTLKSLPCDVFLASHGRFFQMLDKAERLRQGASPNPFIDPEGYRAFLQSTEKKYLDQLADETTSKQR